MPRLPSLPSLLRLRSTSRSQRAWTLKLWERARGAVWFLVLGALCLGALKLSARFYVRSDWSPDQRYTLARETLGLVDRLTEPLVITALLPLSASPPYREVAHHTRDLLYELTSAHPLAQLEVIDVAIERSVGELNSLRARADAVKVKTTRLSTEREGRRTLLEVPYGVSLAYLNQRVVTPPVERLSEVEYQLASALERLIERRPEVRIGVAQGSGEPDLINSPLAQTLRAEGTLIPVRLDQGPIEDEVSLLVILGATQSYGERARWVIDRLRCDGGAVVIALDHRAQSELIPDVWAGRPTGLEPLFKRYGVEVDHRWVIHDALHPSPAPLTRDARGHIVASPHPLYPLAAASAHPISAPLAQVSIPMAPLITLPSHADVVARAYPSAEGLKGLKGLIPVGVEERRVDPRGFPLAFTLEETLETCLTAPRALAQGGGGAPLEERTRGVAPSRLAMIGSGRRLLSADSRGLELLINAITWARGDERLLALKRRRPAPPSLTLSVSEQRALKWVTPALPSALIALLAWISRRPSRRVFVRSPALDALPTSEEEERV